MKYVTNSTSLYNRILLFCAGFSMLLYWILFAIKIPMSENYIVWVLDNDWVWVNSIGFGGAILGFIGLDIIFRSADINRKQVEIFYWLSQVGIIILIIILFYETFIQKEIALRAPELVNLSQGIQESSLFKIPIYIGGIILGTGISGFILKLYKTKTYPGWMIVLLGIGILTFGLLFLPGQIRLVGVISYSTAMIGLSTPWS